MEYLKLICRFYIAGVVSVYSSEHKNGQSQVNYFVFLKMGQIMSVQRFCLGLIVDGVIENPWWEVGCLYRNLNSDPVRSFPTLAGFLCNTDHNCN